MLAKVESETISLPEAETFTVIGDPGCDGHGAAALLAFETALRKAEGEFVIVVGDVAPLGEAKFYRAITDLADAATDKPVFVMPGNHDGPEFESYFGLRNFAVGGKGFTLIAADNSTGRFTDDTLDFLLRTLDDAKEGACALLAHIPPPNRFSGKSMSIEDWRYFIDVVGKRRTRIGRIVSGHVHSYFEDEVGGVRLVATGGGGAWPAVLEQSRVRRHHVVEFGLGPGGILLHTLREFDVDGEDGRDLEAQKSFFSAFASECSAHVDYLLDAEEADRRGLPNLARLFRAASEARLRHAASVRRLMSPAFEPEKAVRDAISSEGFDSWQSYRDQLAAALARGDHVTANCIANAVEAGKITLSHFEDALEKITAKSDIQSSTRFVCLSCGMNLTGFAPPDNCPGCGSSAWRFREVE